MEKPIAAAVVAASLALGGLTGAALGAPGIAGATDVATGAASAVADGAGWVQDALDGLVTDGTLTQEQADAVEAALDEARPERGPRGMGHPHLEVVAEALDMTTEELRTALRDGQTIAEIAEGRGVEPQAIVEALVAELEAHLADRVADGDITQERADEILAGAGERLTAVVEGEARPFHRGPGHGRGH